MRGTGADGPAVRDMFSQLHVSDQWSEFSGPPAGGVRHVQLGELVLQQSPDGGVKGGAEIHKQDPSVGSCRVKVLEDEVKGHVLLHRPQTCWLCR